MRLLLKLLLFLLAATAFAAPCSDWNILEDGVDANASTSYGFTLPKVHNEWRFTKDQNMTATELTLINLTGGPGLVLSQGYNLWETGEVSKAVVATSTSMWTLKIVVDGETRLEGPISHVTGFAERASVGSTEIISHPIFQLDSAAGVSSIYEKFVLEFPIAFRDSVRITVTAVGTGTSAPYLFWDVFGWYTESYVSDYNYYCWGSSADTLGWFDYCYLGGLTTDTTGTGLAGGFTRLADVWSTAGTYDSAVVDDETGVGNHSSQRFLESCVVGYNNGSPLRTTLAEAASIGDNVVKVNTGFAGWGSFGERPILILDAAAPHENRNHGSAGGATLNSADSTITFNGTFDTLHVDMADGDSVILFLTNQGTTNGSHYVHAGIEEWMRYAGWYLPGQANPHYIWSKTSATSTANLDGVLAEPNSAILIWTPSISAYSKDTEYTHRYYWVQNHYKSESVRYYQILRHYMHCYVQGAGGLLDE